MQMNQYLLTFRNKMDENEFRMEFDHDQRLFQRLGLISGAAWWTFVGLYSLLYYPRNQSIGVVLALAAFAPLGLFAFIATCYSGLHQYYHWVTAAMNVMAGYCSIFIGHILLHDITLTLVSLVAVTFWVFFILRLRFTIGAIAALSYVIGYQITLATSPIYSYREVFLSSLTIWILYLVCLVAAHAFERSTRQIYIQKQIIAIQSKTLETEKEKSEQLLLNILPASIASRLKNDSSTIADQYAHATVLFADIVGFTSLSSRLSAKEVVEILNDIFQEFDTLLDAHKLEKIKTIGDAYMAVGGIPEELPKNAEEVAEMALDMKKAMGEYSVKTGRDIKVRIGINTGPVVAGIIGKRKFHYDLWGDTVNTASRMESSGIPGEIQVSAETFELLRTNYIFRSRGPIEVKGKGAMQTYILEGRNDQNTIIETN